MNKTSYSFLLFTLFSIGLGQSKTGINQTNGFFATRFLRDSSKIVTSNSAEIVKLIVEFKEEPLFIQNKYNSLNKRVTSFYEDRFNSFSQVIGGSRTKQNILNKTVGNITNEYYKAFFGVSIAVTKDRISEILSLPYVKSVHYDNEVMATLEKSIPQIGVDRVWQSYGNEGEGTRVGIIDSGIDYMHPALGGGIGGTFKVVGGYDFVNDDNDPIDDNGHGTHVAGIISANSATMKGIAPKSTLYALKVLNSNGSGLSSDIISAIERSVDPNQDGDMSDMLNVVNISLGTDFGYPTDATSIAVNNASKLGVVFVVAAGNSGNSTPPIGKENNYFYNGSASIGSPGTAELAITVGAVDSVDKLAWFSSKGPNRSTFGIKPEIVAPGVQVNSAFLNQSTKRLNGTSMAAPMVTGIVALMKSIHPDWNIDRIKSAIVNTGKDVGLTAYKQGGGRVQALEAISSNSWLFPTVLNFGLDDPSSETWVRKDTLLVNNSGEISQTYSVVPSGLQSGIAISVAPSNFSIPAGGSLQVIVTITVNNVAVPVVPDDIQLFTGRLYFNSTRDTLSVPWALARTNRITISFNEAQPFFIGIHPESALYGNSKDAQWISPTTVEMYGYKKGTYDIYTYFPSSEKSKIVFKENVLLNDDAQILTVNSTEATIPLIFRSKDHNGMPFSSYPVTQRGLVGNIPNWGRQTTVTQQSSDTVLVSPVSDRFSFRPVEFQFDASNSRSFHIAQYPTFTGLSSAKLFTNGQEDYIHQKFGFHFPPDVHQAMIVGEFYNYLEDAGEGNLYGAGFDVDTVAVDKQSYAVDGYFLRSADPVNDVAMKFYVINDLQSLLFSLETFPIMTSNDSVVAITRKHASMLTPRHPAGSTMIFGSAPIHLLTLWYNNSFGEATMHFRTVFRGSNREDRASDVNNGTYSVYDDGGNLVFSNPLNDFPRSALQLSPQRYTVVMQSSNFWLKNKKGKIRQTSGFDLSGPKALPPSITSFLVLNKDGIPVDALTKNENGSLLFSSKIIGLMSDDNIFPDSSKAWYRIHGTQQWNSLPLQIVGDGSNVEGFVMKADLAEVLVNDSVAVDLRLFVKDSFGDFNDFQIEPAFAIGNWISGDPNDVGEEPETNIPKDFVVYQNFPNPFNPSTTIRFGLPRQSAVQVEIYNILGQRIAMIDKGILNAGYHYADWMSNDPSGIYFYRVVMTSSDGKSRVYTPAKKMLLIR